MIAASRPAQFDLIDSPAAFAVALIDPVSLEVISTEVTVTATGIEGSPIKGGSGRFVWMGPKPVVPTGLAVSPKPGSGYAAWTYSAAEVTAGISAVLTERGLCRLYLRTGPDYVFPSGATVIRGLLRVVPDVDQQPIQPLAGAQVWLQWKDASVNPALARLGPRCMGGALGDFAASILFPSKASKSYPQAAANGDLALTLYVARPDSVAVWTQAHTADGVVASAQPGQITTLGRPVAWSTLTAG